MMITVKKRIYTGLWASGLLIFFTLVVTSITISFMHAWKDFIADHSWVVILLWFPLLAFILGFLTAPYIHRQLNQHKKLKIILLGILYGFISLLLTDAAFIILMVCLAGFHDPSFARGLIDVTVLTLLVSIIFYGWLAILVGVLTTALFYRYSGFFKKA